MLAGRRRSSSMIFSSATLMDTQKRFSGGMCIPTAEFPSYASSGNQQAASTPKISSTQQKTPVAMVEPSSRRESAVEPGTLGSKASENQGGL